MARGQSIILDYMAGVFIFIIMLSIFMVAWDLYSSRYSQADGRMQMDSIALSASESLMQSQGEPANWTIDPQNAKRIGFVSRQNTLDWTRINAFSSLSYADQKTKLGIDSDFVIRIDSYEGARLATIGVEPNSTTTAVEISRFGILDGRQAKLRLMVYDP